MANATFTSLVNEVYAITKRSDLVAETSLAVRVATLKLHQSDFYPKDLVEAAVQFTTSSFYQTLAYKSLFSNFRSLHYLRKYEGGEATSFLKVVSPDNVLDAYGASKQDICYLAGEVIQIKSSTSLTDFIVGYYANPVTAEDTYKSWIADMHPFAIVEDAAAQVFKMIGFDEQYSVYQRRAAEQMLMVRNYNITAEGF